MSVLADFLSDMVGLFERHPDGLTLDSDLCGMFLEGFRDAQERAELADCIIATIDDERSAEPLFPAAYARALRQQKASRPDWFRDQQDPNVVVIDRGIRTARPFE